MVLSLEALRSALQLAVPAATAARDKLHDALSPAIGNISFNNLLIAPCYKRLAAALFP